MEVVQTYSCPPCPTYPRFVNSVANRALQSEHPARSTISAHVYLAVNYDKAEGFHLDQRCVAKASKCSGKGVATVYVGCGSGLIGCEP